MKVFILNIKCVGKIPYVTLNEKKKKATKHSLKYNKTQTPASPRFYNKQPVLKIFSR